MNKYLKIGLILAGLWVLGWFFLSGAMADGTPYQKLKRKLTNEVAKKREADAKSIRANP